MSLVGSEYNSNASIQTLPSGQTARYSPDQQHCIDDMNQLLKDLEAMDPSDPTLSLSTLCLDISQLAADTARLASSPLKIDQAMASNIENDILNVPFGQYTLAEAAAYYTAKDPNVGPMGATINQLIKDGSLPTIESVLNQLIQNPFTPPTRFS